MLDEILRLLTFNHNLSLPILLLCHIKFNIMLMGKTVLSVLHLFQQVSWLGSDCFIRVYLGKVKNQICICS